MNKKVILILASSWFILVNALLCGQTIDECTVLINGQTVFVGPFGSRFRVTNIPAGRNWVRACILCKRTDGSVLYGLSNYFEVIDSDTFIMIEDFDLSPDPPALIDSLRVTPADPIIEGIGNTTQMTTMATLSDSTQSDVTARIRGTTYRTSNGRIATVNRNGVVTANSPGIVLITASNEGATSVARVIITGGESTSVEGFVQDQNGSVLSGVTVIIGQFGFQTVTDENGRFELLDVPSNLGDLAVGVRYIPDNNVPLIGSASGLQGLTGAIVDAGFIQLMELRVGDADNDGVNDDIELAFGLDPTNPDSDGDGTQDGSEDLDNDGLSNAGEFVMGTDENNPDTDDDGTLDGDEDEDFDGLVDGLEIKTGANPFSWDADRDTWQDNTEFIAGTDPGDPLSHPPGENRPFAITSPLSLINVEQPEPDSRAFGITAPLSFINIQQSEPEDQGFGISAPASFLNQE